MDCLFDIDSTYGLPRVNLMSGLARKIFWRIAYDRWSILDLVIISLISYGRS